MSELCNLRDAAEYIVKQFDGTISTMKLQKLLYFSQGWCLALLNRKLVDTTFEAWKWGPVSRPLYAYHRQMMEAKSGIFHGNPRAITGNNQKIIDAVIQNYGGLSGMQMGELTHQPGTPWSNARALHGIIDQSAPASARIGDDDIRNHFRKLLFANQGQS